jgi:hypothetical protein
VAFALASPASQAAAGAEGLDAGPTVSASPGTDLLDGQSVVVSGNGFSVDVTEVDIVQCAAANACTASIDAPATGGSFSSSFTVRRFVGSTDCAAAFGTCIVAAANLDGGAGAFTEIGSVPIGLVAAATVPAAPTIGSAIGGPGQATVSWTAPASDGGSGITGYVVTPYIGFYPLPSQSFSGAATTRVVTGLVNGTQHRFRVQAVNAIGTGPYSRVTNAVIPALTPPGAPTIGSAAAGSGQATVSWTGPAADGGSAITGYVVTPYIGYYPLAPQPFASTATTQIVTGLVNGTQYRFRVQAVNVVGMSSYSKVTNPVTPTA